MKMDTAQKKLEGVLDRLEDLQVLEGEARYEGHPAIAKGYLREIRRQERRAKRLVDCIESHKQMQAIMRLAREQS